MLGTLTTSVLGYVRAFVVARYFGQTNDTDAFYAALTVPQMVYDQLIGGTIGAVLIPSFTRLAGQDDRELWRLVGAMLTLVVLALLGAVLLLEAAAQPVMQLIASGFNLRTHPGTLPLAVKLLRLLLPALLFMGLSAVALATLYSLGRRAVASFTTGCYHLGIILAAVLAAARWGIAVLAVGAVAGAALQFAAQVPALTRARGRTGSLFRRFDLHDPTLRHMIRLYLPVAAGMCVSIAGQIADINFKSHLPQHGGLTSMQNATQLIQFPVGIVISALGYAMLPSISADAAAGDLARFKETLVVGFRLVLVLMVPAMVGTLTLATPIVALLFEGGKFTHQDTLHTATALLGYAPQLPFIGLDQLLIAAFYARHNTVTPVLVGVVGVGVYVAVAALLLGPLTIFGLALANTVQIAAHAVILLLLLLGAIGSLPLRPLGAAMARIGLAAGGMAAAALAAERWLAPSGAGALHRLAALGLPMLLALAVYAGLLLLLQLEEATLAWQVVARRTTRLRGVQRGR